MELKEVYDRVVKVTADVLGVDAATIKAESSFIYDLGAESTQSVQLVAAFEEAFDIEMDAEDALSVQSVGDAATFIKRYVDAK